MKKGVAAISVLGALLLCAPADAQDGEAGKRLLGLGALLGRERLETLTLPTTVRSSIVIPPHRQVVVADDTEVVPGGRVELAAGDIVAFSKGKGLFIRGGELVVRGTTHAPVTFTSAESKPTAGYWTGLVFDWTFPPGDAGRLPSSLVEHAVIEYGGAPWKGRDGIEGAGGISLVGYVQSRKRATRTGELSIRHVALRDNANRGLDARTDATVRLTQLRFGHNAGVSARIDLDFGDQLGVAPTEAVELVGVLRRSVTLPRLAKPYVVTESLTIASYSDTPEAILTIASGATVAFRRGKGLSLGGYFAGGLVAHGVTFTSAESPPRAGDWRGMTFMAPGSADLMDDVFEYGGEDGFPVVSVGRANQANVKIQRSAFRNNAGPAIGGGGSCAAWRRPSLANTSAGQPICVDGRQSIPAALSAGAATPPPTEGQPAVGSSAPEATALLGIWEVEDVGVNMADQPHWKWLPDDPQLVGREFVVSAEEVHFADFKQANCKPATWRKKTFPWKDLVDDVFLGPVSKQTPAAFRIKASLQAKVQVFEPCALTVPGRQAPGNNWTLSSWVVPVAADKLIMGFDSDSVLYLSRRSPTPKASFDCAKAKTPTEKAICGDANLAAWDRSIALAWKRQRERDGGVDSTIKAKHVEWLRTRDACGADAACLAKTMQEHTSYLVGAR